MKTFPMFLQMAGRRVVIAGGAENAAQKCRLMLKTEAAITVLAPSLEPELADLREQGRIQWEQGRITPEVFRDTALVFVATGCPATDACLHMLARDGGAVVNVVDQPELCDAITPSIVDRSPVVVAIGTEGTAPVLARQIKTRMEELLEPRLGGLAALAGRLRNRAALRLSPRDRRDLWRWVFAGPVRQAYANGAERQAAIMIKQAIDTGSFGGGDDGSVSVVGTGPGPKDLMTLRAVQRLQEADIIYYAPSVDPEILELARRDAQRVRLGLSHDQTPWPDRGISGILMTAARQGQRVVHLVQGCPMTAHNSTVQQSLFADAGIAYELVAGLPPADDSTADQTGLGFGGLAL